jgi:ABC-type transport system involved in multi-copper enzyme maturation permease subunit
MNINRVKTIACKDTLDTIRDGRILVALVLPFAMALFFDATWNEGNDVSGSAVALSVQQHHAVFMMIPLLFLIILIAAFVVPIMLAEETERKTLDVLVMISSYREVVTAKAAVGVLYVAVALALMLWLIGIQPANIFQFGLATALLTVTLIVFGLLLGGLFRNANQLNTWSAVLLMPLMLPAIFVPETMSNMPDLPNWAQIALDAHPVSHGLQLMINGVTGETVYGDQLQSIGIIAAWAVVGYIVLLWNLHRRHRAA